MKELTIEEKAKAYDKAIERAKSLLSNNQLGNAWIYKLLPELKESEDERIRKGLIGYFRAGKCENISSYHGISTDDILAWLEKQGEQKPADKVEPKFKVGDWAIFDNGNVECITSVGTHGYTFDDGDYLLHDDCDKNAHLWTINDAKDGDVLASEDKVFIYNGKFDLRGRICAYCGIYKTYDGLRFIECAIGNYFTYKEPHPTTKEQRDLLFQKMREAGYEWDAKKKELKPTDTYC